MDRKNNAIKESEEKMDINALVATEVMGWVYDDEEIPGVNYPHCWCDKKTGITFFVRDWKPDENIAQAWQVVEKMNEAEFFLDLYYNSLGVKVDFYNITGTGSSQEDSIPKAICLAALKAVGVEV